MDFLKENIEKINSIVKSNKLSPYIDYIRFPYFKNIHQDTKIEFRFPLTVLVGKNGCGKSSVLHALYGAPEGRSTGDFWFSTNLDPIRESDDRNRMIYGYYSIEAKKNVEVLKTRIQYKKGGGKIVNPDYWEPSRPSKRDGMEDMPALPEGKDEAAGRSKTRWNAIRKNVVYLNFRSELSAFDRLFNFHTLTNSTHSKQDYLRNWSRKLKHAIDVNATTYPYYGKDRIRENRDFTEYELKSISLILDKNYQGGRYIEHNFFKADGYSVIFKTDKIQYSEAFAGSGESIIARLVVKVLNAPEHSLILLDEPEVSLHPAAQKELRKFLLEQIINKKHQVIMATHSPVFVEGMPSEAIKLFYPNPASGKFEVRNETYPADAFHHLGSLLHSKKTIIVEDKLAQKIVVKALKLIGTIHKDYDIEFYPGGVNALIGSYIPYHSIRNDKDVWFVLDGDQKHVEEHIDPDTIPVIKNENLSELIKNQVGQDVKFNQDSNDPDQKVKLQRNFLKFYRERVFYLPSKTPEKLIWDNVEELKNREENPECYKGAFKVYAEEMFGEEDVNSGQIFNIQQLMLNKLPDDCEDMKILMTTLKSIINKSV
ncbi:MAG: ATP-dependent nuclease [Methylococcaceae bacterium]